jgi:hypothetical protein
LWRKPVTPSVVRITAQGKVKDLGCQEAGKDADLTDLDTMIPVIQALIPLGLQAFRRGDAGRGGGARRRLESLNALVEQRTAKVDHWRTSDQKQRWLAAALLDIEPRLRRITGFRALPLLRQALLTAQGAENTAATQAA